MPQFVNCSPGDALQPRRIYRATWARSIVGDLTDLVTFEYHSDSQLELYAANVAGQIPALGIGWKSAGPNVLPAADAFTIDITIQSTVPAGSTVARLADQLDGIGGSSLTVTRLELVGTSETQDQASRARDAASADAANDAGVTAIPGEVASGLKKSVVFIAVGIYVVFFVLGNLTEKQRANWEKLINDVW